MVLDYSSLIQKQLQNKIDMKEEWENEFGTIHRRVFNKEEYCCRVDFKILYHTSNETLYFKIVPNYFSIPNSHAFWDYRDGYIIDTIIYWENVK